MAATLPKSHTCDICQFLQFDDSEHGGFASQSKPESLEFSADNQTFVVGAWSDSLPVLPELKLLADTGCNFSRTLRVLVLNHDIPFQGRVNIQFEYEWGHHQWGLCSLVARVGLVMSIDEAIMCQKDFHKFEKYYEDGMIIDWYYSVSFTIESGTGNCTSWLDLAPEPASEVLCAENVVQIRHEIQRCVGGCHPPRPSSFMPTRLLYLGSSETDAIRLVETANLHDVPQYVALSYCWGPPDEARTQLKTETFTVKDRKRNILSNIMSRVMQDAVETTRALCFQYIWIDALCIIQDDKQDWEREAASMGLVYSNAILTLCALASSSCHEGFLERSVPDISVPFQSSVDPHISGSYTLRPHPAHEDRGFLATPELLDGQESTWPLRGWTFQEYEMSTRILFIGRSRIHLLCPSTSWIESGHSRSNPKYNQAFLHHIMDFEDGIIEKQELYEFWLALLERYGHRHCTYASDKLPAISGIAKLMATAIDDTYIAGMWTGSLEAGLLWSFGTSPAHSGLESHVQAHSVADTPSWSWIEQSRSFIHGHSLFYLSNDDDISTECKKLTAESDAAVVTLNPFGSAIHATLFVAGKTRLLEMILERVHIEQKRQAWKATLGDAHTAWVELDYAISHNPESLVVGFKMLLIASATGLAYPNQRLSQIAAKREGRFDEWQSNGSDTDSDSESDDDSDDAMRHAWGILLVPSESTGKYYRVGIFTLRSAETGGLAFFDGCDYEELEIM